MINEMPFHLLDIILEEIRKRPKFRFWLTLISGVLAVTIFALYISAPYIFTPEAAFVSRQYGLPAAVITGFTFLIAATSYTPARLDIFGVELKSIRQEREVIQQRLADTPKTDVFDTIQLNLNQLSEYYTINKSQAVNSFRFSVFAVVVGLITLIAGIWLFYFQTTPNLQMTVISSISGLLITFIGGAYFYLYRKGLDQLNYFFEQLIRMQDTMLAVKLSENFPNKEKHAELTERIIIALLDRSSSEYVIPKHSKEIE